MDEPFREEGFVTIRRVPGEACWSVSDDGRESRYTRTQLIDVMRDYARKTVVIPDGDYSVAHDLSEIASVAKLNCDIRVSVVHRKGTGVCSPGVG